MYCYTDADTDEDVATDTDIETDRCTGTVANADTDAG